VPIETQPETKQRLSLYELVQTPAFEHLSLKQGVFILTYLQGYLDTGVFDPVAATQASYDCASKESARIFSFQLMANPKIQLAINSFFSATPEEARVKTELDTQIASVRETVRQAPPYARADAQRLLAELTGLVAPSKFKTKSADSQADEPEDSPTAEASKISESDSTSRVPAGATALADSRGVVKGYKTADGRYIQLADVEVTR
jgi:hypothetical protein